MKQIILNIYNFILNPRNFFRFRTYNIRKYHYFFLYFIYYPYNRKRINYLSNLERNDESYFFLKENGYLEIDLTDNLEVKDNINSVLLESNDFLKDYKNEKEVNIYKEYLINLTQLNKKNKECEKLIKLASNKKIVSIIAKYLGMLPTITFAAYWYTPFLNSQPKGSQLLHLDHEEFKQIKMFIYCSDVKLENGPMHIINKNDSKKIQKKINYTTNDKDKRISDESVKKYKITNFSGPKKRIFLVDTSSCFHFGGRLSSGDRLVGIVQYLTPLNYNYKNLKKKLPVINKKNLLNKSNELFRF